MNINQKLEWLYHLTNHEKKPGSNLNPYQPGLVQVLLQKSGFWPWVPKVFHVAGTKGKGSTATYLASMLSSQAKTGLFTSPHVECITERLMIDGVPIQIEALIALALRFRETIEAVGATFFDALTFMACVWFQESGCEFVVLETGLGGRLDSTNFCDPRIALITPISYDHTSLLGHTLAEIAREKAGIIKPDRPVVVAPQPVEALEVLQRVSNQEKAPLLLLEHEVRWAYQTPAVHGLKARYELLRSGMVFDVSLAMASRVYVQNFAHALYTYHLVGFEIHPDVLQPAANLQLKARMEWKNGILFDGAHNDASIRALFETIKEMKLSKNIELWLGVLEDKELERMASVVKEYRFLFDSIHVFEFEAYRKSGGEKMYQLLQGEGVFYEPELKPKHHHSHIKVVTGSFYSVKAYQFAVGE